MKQTLDERVGDSISEVKFEEIVPNQGLVYFLITGEHMDVDEKMNQISAYVKVIDGYVGEGTYYQVGIVPEEYTEMSRVAFKKFCPNILLETYPGKFRRLYLIDAEDDTPQRGFQVQSPEFLPDDVLTEAYETLRTFAQSGIDAFQKCRISNFPELKCLFYSIAYASLGESNNPVDLKPRLKEMNLI